MQTANRTPQFAPWELYYRGDISLEEAQRRLHRAIVEERRQVPSIFKVVVASVVTVLTLLGLYKSSGD